MSASNFVNDTLQRLIDIEDRLSDLIERDTPSVFSRIKVPLGALNVWNPIAPSWSSIKIGYDVSGLALGNRFSYIDFVGDDTYTDYGLRLIRYNNGVNSNSVISHRGLGAILLEAADAGGSIYTKVGGVDKTITLAVTNTWGAITLLNGWQNYAGGFANAEYTKNPDGYVKVRGLIKLGTITNGTIIGTLPAGNRPTVTSVFTGIHFDGTKDIAYRLDVQASGNIVIQSVASSSYLSLESIWFPTF